MGDGWDDHFINWGIMYPSPNTPAQPLGTTAVVNLTQKWFVGATGDSNPGATQQQNLFTSMCVQTNKIQSYLDHAERQNTVSPVAAGTISSIPAVCRSGVFVNP